MFRRHPSVNQDILYGSRAKGTYKPGSDIDLTIVGNQLDATKLLKIETELDDLLLPYQIDLFLLHQIENPDIIDHIKRVGRLFFERADRF